MDRQAKIEALQRVKEGIPLRLALRWEALKMLVKLDDAEYYTAGDGEKVSIEDYQKYLRGHSAAIHLIDSETENEYKAEATNEH